ncbi:sigma-70 family RNA polymerase sigma factor [Saccharibacillus sp. CPCC 101409]|uniref:sigma-70 family RNA polymerase sigma factor n=1 Tax=Saccharibacillus sp. CPCC 101409 TaxID=3058041 RepID=UPI0026726ADF|nr:sigma-70 family RNA polymerase sigma factor [Saccharibacillus sp. CPCC 101409]MDO3411520.1 sigma-70 family RNA polymerase sigma factor [Saccharibacillus sp. CPCC 101409]
MEGSEERQERNFEKEREKKLVRRIRARDEAALGELIEAYGGLLKAIVYRQLPDRPQDREECLDDVLLAIWNHIESFDGERNSLRQWTAAVARYRAIDYQRRWLREKERRSGEELDAERLRGTEENEAIAADSVDEMLAQLPAEERILFERYYLEGVPARELAQGMNVRESWIHNKLSRGRRKLKQIWTSRNGVEGE